MNIIQRIYYVLYEWYGPQGWWPLLDRLADNSTPTSLRYHPSDYSYPHTDQERFEIWIGTILTQNCRWSNVISALSNLAQQGLIDNGALRRCDLVQLATIITPAGFHNQKARKIKQAAQFFHALQGRIPQRTELLKLWGIGPESADSILLYSHQIPTFVVDSYSRRILINLKLIDDNARYDDIKALFETNLVRDVTIYQEYHALIVEHAKRYYRSPDRRSACPLLKIARHS